MENILDKLNQEQIQAVKETRGALLVLAGAGSGKTRVLTSRIAYLVNQGAYPRDILAVTFTNKAAKEMKERLSSILGEDVVKYMWVGTFHSICGRILRQDVDKLIFSNGKTLDKNFTIYDETDSVAVIKNAIKKLNLDDKVYVPKLVKTVISNAKNKMQDANSFATFARDYKTQKIAMIFEEYENTLINNNAIDFDDMLLLGVRLLEQNSEIREKYFNRFKHILVDEFQDTNLAQYKLINMLYTNNCEEFDETTRSLCVVGDVDQSIYSWRGADYKIILNFQRDFRNAKVIKLEQNYRSTSNILNAANNIIENNEQRIDKVLYSQKGEGEKIVYYEAQDESDEANYIVQTIKSKVVDFNKVAILYRTNSQSRALEEACIANSLPYRIYGGLKFYDRKEVKDVIAYLKLIHNNNDSQSFKRIVNVPKRAIGETTIKTLQTFAEEQDINLFDAVERIEETGLNKSSQTKLKDFAKLILALKEVEPKYNLQDFITLVLEKTEYIKMLQKDGTPEDENRIDNIQELVNVAGEFEPEENDNILGEFLAQVALVSDIDGMENISNNVTLMTLHSAKGLEFSIVFLAGLDEGLFPHQRTFNSVSELEEERRLMYVGVTRAEEELFITSAKRRSQWGDYKYYNPSRFLDEIPSELMQCYSSDSSITSKSTFKNAVNRARTVFADDDGYVRSSTGFGSNFVAPGREIFNKPQVKPFVKSSPARTILAKNKLNKAQEDKKIQEFLKNNAFKKKMEDRKRQEEEELRQKQEKLDKIPAPFDKGDKVYHDTLGAGLIVDIFEVGESTMYTIDFAKKGKKAMDAKYARLKKI